MTMSLIRQSRKAAPKVVCTYLLIYLNLDQTIVGCPKMLNMITLSTLLEIALSMTLKVIEKLYCCFKNDTDIEAHRSLHLSTSLT